MYFNYNYPRFRLLADYMAQISAMISNNKSTLFVNFRHVINVSALSYVLTSLLRFISPLPDYRTQADHELAEAIELEYYRFEPYLRHALQDVIAVENQHYIFDVDKGQRYGSCHQR